MRDTKEYLSKFMFYSIIVTNLLQIIFQIPLKSNQVTPVQIQEVAQREA